MQDNNVHANPNWQQRKPKLATLITNHLLVTYDMTQEVKGTVAANWPGIVILDEKEKKDLIIDATIPMDINMIKAAADKYEKYQDLEIANKKQYHLKKVHTILIVVGALGTICQNLDGLLAQVSPRANLDLIQKEVLLGSARTICHVLTDLVK
eukprot:7657844-Ditylum_brightwellii.AAC.1